MRLALHWQVLIGLAVGVLYAWMSITFGWNDFTVDYIKPFGDIFINILKLIAVPLVLFSIISGVASLGDPAKLGQDTAHGLPVEVTFAGLHLVLHPFHVRVDPCLKLGRHGLAHCKELRVNCSSTRNSSLR